MRVNARFEGLAEQQVTYLAASTGMKVSDVLRESVDFYYRHVRAEGGKLKHLSSWIGKGDSGRSDVSANVKLHLDEGLDAKFPAAKRPAARSARKSRSPK